MREDRAGTRRQALMQRPWRRAPYWLALVARPTCFLREPRTACSGMALSTVDGVLPINHLSRKYSHPVWWGDFQLRSLLFTGGFNLCQVTRMAAWCGFGESMSLWLLNTNPTRSCRFDDRDTRDSFCIFLAQSSFFFLSEVGILGCLHTSEAQVFRAESVSVRLCHV